MRRLAICIGILALLFSAARAQAVPIGIGGFSGSETVIDFTELGGNILPPGPFTIGEVTFTGEPGWRLLDGNVLGTVTPALAVNADPSQIRLDFASPKGRVGLNYGAVSATFIVSIFDAGLTFLEQTVVSPPAFGSNVFVGFENLAGISRLVITETGDDGFLGALDDIRFELAPIPEPSTMLLLGSGLAGLGWYRRRRKAACLARVPQDYQAAVPPQGRRFCLLWPPL